MPGRIRLGVCLTISQPRQHFSFEIPVVNQVAHIPCYYLGMVTIMAGLLADRVRRLRTDLGWTQGQLATYARVKRSWLSNLESGEIENPRADYLVAVARALDTTVEYLTTGRRNETADGIAVHVPPEKVGNVRWFARLPNDALARLRIIALQANLAGAPPKDESEDEGDDDLDGDSQSRSRTPHPAGRPQRGQRGVSIAGWQHVSTYVLNE